MLCCLSVTPPFLILDEILHVRMCVAQLLPICVVKKIPDCLVNNTCYPRLFALEHLLGVPLLYHFVFLKLKHGAMADQKQWVHQCTLGITMEDHNQMLTLCLRIAVAHWNPSSFCNQFASIPMNWPIWCTHSQKQKKNINKLMAPQTRNQNLHAVPAMRTNLILMKCKFPIDEPLNPTNATPQWHHHPQCIHSHPRPILLGLHSLPFWNWQHYNLLLHVINLWDGTLEMQIVNRALHQPTGAPDTEHTALNKDLARLSNKKLRYGVCIKNPQDQKSALVLPLVVERTLWPLTPFQNYWNPFRHQQTQYNGKKMWQLALGYEHVNPWCPSGTLITFQCTRHREFVEINNGSKQHLL